MPDPPGRQDADVDHRPKENVIAIRAAARLPRSAGELAVGARDEPRDHDNASKPPPSRARPFVPVARRR